MASLAASGPPPGKKRRRVVVNFEVELPRCELMAFTPHAAPSKACAYTSIRVCLFFAHFGCKGSSVSLGPPNVTTMAGRPCHCTTAKHTHTTTHCLLSCWA
jgi:hypothetical protein